MLQQIHKHNMLNDCTSALFQQDGFWAYFNRLKSKLLGRVRSLCGISTDGNSN